MRCQILVTLLFLATAYTVQAQCNTKEYTRIFNEASALQEKGEYIESKNRYEAAKIYVCTVLEQNTTDAAIDALFTQMDTLRKSEKAFREKAESETLKYQKMRDTAIQERLRADIVIESFGLKQQGDISLQNKEPDKAYDYYQRAIKKLSELPYMAPSSIEWILKEQLEENLTQTSLLIEKYKEHLDLISEGDRYVNDRNQLDLAYTAYLKAWKLNVDTQQALLKLKDLEIKQGQYIITSKLKGQQYYQLLYHSAETNLILGNTGAAYSKIGRVLFYSPSNIDFIKNDQLKKYAQSSRQMTFKRFGLYLAQNYFLHEKINGFSNIRKNSATVGGIQFKLNKNLNVSIEFYNRKIENTTENLSKIFKHYETSPLLFEYALFRSMNRKWSNTCFEIYALAGGSFGEIKMSINEWRLPSFLGVSSLNMQLTKNLAETFSSSQDLQYQYILVNDSIIESSVSNIRSITRYLNGYVGVSTHYAPFPKAPMFAIYSSVRYRTTIPSIKGSTYSIKKGLLSYMENRYDLSENDVNNLGFNYDKVEAPVDFDVENYEPNWFSHLELKIGILFKFNF